MAKDPLEPPELDQAKIERDIETLRESLRLDVIDLRQPGLSKSEREGILKHWQWVGREIVELIEKCKPKPGK